VLSIQKKLVAPGNAFGSLLSEGLQKQQCSGRIDAFKKLASL